MCHALGAATIIGLPVKKGDSARDQYGRHPILPLSSEIPLRGYTPDTDDLCPALDFPRFRNWS